ncbi:hypothetical protein LTR78_000830 [Recurvomyces mirabilis]|uniref:Uncharacterized protein n=1 Tax=Recurvomyces mirabilis TaxID=574656 RepID=A0AAE1C5W7_9PEZI|nr:hypothetical protein LTR78_000830 [Recurvomyces mirabilis]KAK5158799.1 hypothetical protein LTS14_002907 [Recurvomyces mirabilis]
MAATTPPPTAKVEALPLSVDSQWIWTYNGQDWPVVLCGDELAPSQFVAGPKSKYERIDDSDVAKLSKQRGLAFAQDVKEFQTAAY